VNIAALSRLSLLLGALVAFFSSNAACQKQVTYLQVVKQATTSTSVASSAGIIRPGSPVQLTATVAPTNPTYPAGTVVFMVTGSNPANVTVSQPIALGGGSTAVWVTSIAAIDAYSVVAAYSGDSNYLGSQSSPVLVSVTGSPDFTLSTPSSAQVTQGSSVAIPVTVSSINGFSGTVAFKCSGVPAMSSCNFAHGSVTIPPPSAGSSASGGNSATTTLTLSTTGVTVTTLGMLGFFFSWCGFSRKKFSRYRLVWISAALLLITIAGCAGPNRHTQSNGTPVGNYSLTIMATSGAITHSSTVDLQVLAQ
jgi:hypothetical protein